MISGKGYTYFFDKKTVYIPRVDKRNVKVESKAKVTATATIREGNEKPRIDDNIVNYFKKVRSDFPFFQQRDCPVYFDSAATSQKPGCVIKDTVEFYAKENANIHRGIYKLSLEATNRYEHVRELVKQYINCDNPNEIIFTSGTTHGINIVCNIIMQKIVKKKEDEIYLSYLEHNSNIIPWQEEVKKKKKGKIKYMSLKRSGYIHVKKLMKSINCNTKVISISHVSNVLGNIQNINLVIKRIKNLNPNIIVVIDAAQSFPHLKYDIKEMVKNGSDPDILIASGHKFCGLLGSGFIYIKNTLTRSYKLKPLLFGSNIVTEVGKYKSSFVKPPHLFETGTQNISAILSMGVALQFMQKVSTNHAYAYEMYLYDLLLYHLRYLLGESLVELPLCRESGGRNDSGGDDLRIYVHNSRRLHFKKVGILPLWSNRFTSFDLVTFLDFKNVCIRSGHHCASLLHTKFLKVADTSRISILFYNTPEEVQYLAEQIAAVSRMLSGMKK
ncbi:cysteine desulfurase, putative [Plasmodium ovale]|uniref:Cysteine desulfurase, putative n=2 Tax=Plasmodium ovale TaxID=36330 RepID=A0A1D3KX97_PLAOA|nr:cysteine desulfurase, putative (SufS) [Plasmodium ovale curtisi]SBS80985.1 cysteine desulfurase, putative (SufS) [Plasmodium ovale curtisi]SCA48422.1 cysteine desulfurase, putative [Plasmodium ovale]